MPSVNDASQSTHVESRPYCALQVIDAIRETRAEEGERETEPGRMPETRATPRRELNG